MFFDSFPLNPNRSHWLYQYHCFLASLGKSEIWSDWLVKIHLTKKSAVPKMAVNIPVVETVWWFPKFGMLSRLVVFRNFHEETQLKSSKGIDKIHRFEMPPFRIGLLEFHAFLNWEWQGFLGDFTTQRGDDCSPNEQRYCFRLKWNMKNIYIYIGLYRSPSPLEPPKIGFKRWSQLYDMLRPRSLWSCLGILVMADARPCPWWSMVSNGRSCPGTVPEMQGYQIGGNPWSFRKVVLAHFDW